MNYGAGDLFNFHGAFIEKTDALKKEKTVPGAFIKDVWYRTGPRYGVLTRNPRARKRNVEWGTYEKGIFHPWTRRPKTRKKPAKRRRNATTKARKKPRNPFGVLSGLSALSNLKDLGGLVPKAKRRKRNYADAADLYTKFHGRGPHGTIDTKLPIADYDGNKELGQLGKLVSLTIDGHGFFRKKISWGSREAPDLAATPNGKQLYFVGGNQDLSDALESLPIDNRGNRVTLGAAYQIEYFTQKGFDNFQPVTYYHDLGEETGHRPRVVYDKRKKRIHLVGGAYVVKPEGIVN